MWGVVKRVVRGAGARASLGGWGVVGLSSPAWGSLEGSKAPIGKQVDTLDGVFAVLLCGGRMQHKR